MKEPEDNTLQSLIERIENIEKKEKKKDIWDIISILSSFLIPLSIFFAGYFLSEADRKAKIASANKEIELAEIKSKVDQAQLVSNFLEALVDSNSYKRKLAIKSILLALPEKGAEIVEEISTNDPNEDVKEFAAKSLTNSRDQIRLELVRNVFSPEKQKRLVATEKLTTDWTHDEFLISVLIEFASGRFGEEQFNMSGIINTIVILNRMDIELIRKDMEQVSGFIEKVEQLKDRKQTQAYLEDFKKRLK